MCSIFGIVLSQELSVTGRLRAKTMMDCMALEGATRGRDATGIGVVWPGNKCHVVKAPIDSYQMIAQEEWKQAMYHQEGTPLAVLGHTRQKTHGENTIENAHPFLFSSATGLTMGIHNGVISNHEVFGGGLHKVDSANLLSEIATNNLPQLKDTLFKVVGSYALAFVHRNRFFLARNPDSPCYVARVPGLKAYAFASTEHMLRLAASRSGLRLDTITSLKPGVLASFNWTTGAWKNRTYEYFSSTGSSLGSRKSSKKDTDEKNVKSCVTKMMEDREVVETVYDNGVFVSVTNYKCAKCKKVKPECDSAGDICKACKNDDIVMEALTAQDNPIDISDERIERLLTALEAGAHVPCTKCKALFNKRYMRRGTVMRGVLCCSCEAQTFTTWYNEQKEKHHGGKNYCTMCNQLTKTVMYRNMNEQSHWLCTTCDNKE